ncbi:MAG: NAD(P)/FAD-dependent oxidoreductase [Rhodobacteraceae bacterium]|nr:NAD(P)/FAD-dependent oxidoreductase [Paracoccaceae bacterium]
MTQLTDSTRTVDILVIGAGLGGLGAAAKLIEAGRTDIAVLEAAETVGGVWRINQYPNVACDTPIDLYAYSFCPGDKWSSNFAPGDEILAYLHEFADLYGVTPRIVFNTRVSEAVWDEATAHWRVTATDGRVWIARYLVWSGGLFSQPSLPVVRGVESFAGLSLHSTEWHDGIDLSGKRVAVVGGGATAIQIVPYAQEHADHLVAFVRTPSYVLPRPEIAFSPAERGTAQFAAEQRSRRTEWFNRFEVIARSRFPMNGAVIAEQEAVWQEQFDAQVTDPHARAVLAPDYRFGCKRPLFSSAYYPAITQPNVTLVGRGVSHLDGDSIVDVQGDRYPVDVVVWATGFSPTDMLGGIVIRGRDGRELGAEWRDLPRAFFGVLVDGFPNFFLINGPNAGGASVTDVVEAQVDFILRGIAEAEARGAASLSVSPEVFADFNADIQRRANSSVMVQGNCNSYYRVGGDGAVFTHWPDTIEAFQRRIAAEGLAGIAFDQPARVV